MNKSTNLLTVINYTIESKTESILINIHISFAGVMKRTGYFIRKKVSYILLVETKITLISYQPGDVSS